MVPQYLRPIIAAKTPSVYRYSLSAPETNWCLIAPPPLRLSTLRPSASPQHPTTPSYLGQFLCGLSKRRLQRTAQTSTFIISKRVSIGCIPAFSNCLAPDLRVERCTLRFWAGSWSKAPVFVQMHKKPRAKHFILFGGVPAIGPMEL